MLFQLFDAEETDVLGSVLPRGILFFLSVLLSFGLVQADMVRSAGFENQGNKSVYRLFFVSNGYVYAGLNEQGVRKKATDVALRFGLAECRRYLNERGLSESSYTFKSSSNNHPIQILSSKIFDAGFQGTGLVAVRIVGEVEYEFSLNPTSAPQILSVNLASDKSQYRAGDHLYFALRGNMKFYGSLLDLNPVGELIQLLPNGSRKQSAYAAQTSYLFPDRKSGDSFDLVVGPPFGLEQIKIIVSDTKIEPILDESAVGEGFGVIERDFAWANKQLREQVVRQLKNQPLETTFYCVQVYGNSVDLTTSQSGYGR